MAWGWLKKVGKIASIAAPIVAAPFTGGASLALIGAGAGAANAALNGRGVGGILKGAAFGAIPGVGKAAGAVKAAGTAGKILSGAGKFVGGGGSAVGGTAGKILDIGTKVAPILTEAAKSKSKANQDRDILNQSADRTALERYRLGVDAPGARLKQSINASRAANFQPVTASWGGPGSGLRGETVKFSGGFANPNMISPDVKAQADDLIHQNLMTQLQHGADLPTMSVPGRESVGDKILGGAGFGASILSAVRNKPPGPLALPPVDPQQMQPPAFDELPRPDDGGDSDFG